MPRTARVKSPSGIYHIMIRSISDTPLFKNDTDKNKYLELIRKYQNIFLFRVYAYCLMTTHAHFIIDSAGADVSKFMKAINLSYAIYFNKKYNRHGHLFQDRFKSKLITNDKYLTMLSVYIHNNARDLKRYKNNIEKYQYSSLGIYLGIHKNSYGILNPDYILQHFGSNVLRAKEQYLSFMNRYSENNDSGIGDKIDFINDRSEYRSGRNILIRDYSPEHIVSFITNYIKTPFSIYMKHNHKNSELKAVCVVIMRSLCNFSLKQIASVLGNITSSNVSRLCEKGIKLITEKEIYMPIINELLKSSSVI
jgi:putative transposase